MPYAGPFTFIFYRYLALTLLVCLYLMVSGQLLWTGWRYVRQKMLIGVLAHGVWLSCVLLAIDYGVPAGLVALVVALQPLATGALSGKVVGEPTPWSSWAGLVVGFTGVAIPVLSRVDFQDSSDMFAWFIPLGSVIAITAASLYQRKLSVKNDHQNQSVSLSLFYQSLATTMAAAVPAFLVENGVVEWSLAFISATIWLVIGVSFGAYALMWILVDRMDATKVASLFYLGPPVTMLMAWGAFGDTIEAVDLAGLAVVCAGVLLTYIKPSSA